MSESGWTDKGGRDRICRDSFPEGEPILLGFAG